MNLKRLVAATAIFGLLSGLTLAHKGHFENKQSFWENAASTSPHAALAQFNLGVVYYDIGDKIRAEEQFRRTIQLDPEDIASWVNLGTLAMERNDFYEAELNIKKALQLNKEYGYAYGQLAELYKRMGKESERQVAQNRANALGN
jgi:superkiller protein 3